MYINTVHVCVCGYVFFCGCGYLPRSRRFGGRNADKWVYVVSVVNCGFFPVLVDHFVDSQKPQFNFPLTVV